MCYDQLEDHKPNIYIYIRANKVQNFEWAICICKLDLKCTQLKWIYSVSQILSDIFSLSVLNLDKEKKFIENQWNNIKLSISN